MARRTIFWHVGPDDVGTRFLATALDVERERLAADGVQVIGTPADAELVVAELRHTHRALGYRRSQVEGHYAALMRDAWSHRGVSVLSTPGLAGASPDEVALALDAVRGAEIHPVLLVRDAASRSAAAVQAELETGLRVADDAAHGIEALRERWGRTVLPEHVHVIEETEPARIWTALTGLLGVSVELPTGLATGELNADQAAVVRDVVATLGDRLDAAGRRTAVRDLLVDSLLTRPGEASATSALADALLEVADLRQTNLELGEENARLDRKRRKYKRRLRQLTDDAA